MMKIFFAPLQGFTEDSYRRAHFEFVGGVTAYYSPFLRLEKGLVRKKDALDLPRALDLPKGMRLLPQVIAADEIEFGKLVDFVIGQGYKEIDFNMGCPYPMQTSSGRGSGLLPRKETVERILSVIRRMKDEDSSLSFSVKMRLGLNSVEEGLRLVSLLNEAPLSHVTLHPRLGNQLYKGSVDMKAFEIFHEKITHKIIYNGDVTSIRDIENLESRFPNLAGVMIGRGLLMRPSLATEYLRGREFSQDERIELSLKMHEKLFRKAKESCCGDSQILSKLKPFWEYQKELLPKKVYKKLMKSGNLEKYLEALSEIGM